MKFIFYIITLSILIIVASEHIFAQNTLVINKNYSPEEAIEKVEYYLTQSKLRLPT